MKTLNELFSSLGCDEDSGWELLQHQGSPKKIAFELMPTLVELQSEPELWRLIALIAANGIPKVPQLSDDGRARFTSALVRAETRIIEELANVRFDEGAIDLLSTLAASKGLPDAYDILERLREGSTELLCPRCAAHLLVERSGANVALTHSGARHPFKGEHVPSALDDLVASVARSGRDDLRTFVRRLFGDVECPRCRHSFSLAAPPHVSDARRARRSIPHASATIEAGGDAIARLTSRLISIAEASSADAVRLPGVGLFRVQTYRGYEGRNPRTGEVVTVAAKCKVTFDVDPVLLDLVDEGSAPASALPSDDPVLDDLAARILTGFESHDVVALPDFGSLDLHVRPGREGRTVDGDPITVPESRYVTFKAAKALTQRLERRS